MAAVSKNQKGPFLNGPLYFSGTEAFRADMKFSGLSATYVNAYILNVNQPTASGMTVRMADRISGNRPAAAAIAELGQFVFPPCIP